MKQTAYSFVVLSAALGLLALTETTGDAAFSVDGHFPASHFGVGRLPARVEIQRAPDGSPVLVRANSSQDDGISDAYPPFTCAQLQVIDEVEFTSEEDAATATAECNSDAD
jgi:hypothetical protein